MSDDLEFIVIDDIPEYIFCIGDDEENERVIALSGKDGAFKYEKVAELPTTGEDGVLYLVPKAHTTQTASGNPISVNITDDAGKIESLKLDGDTAQQSYTGKNLFDKDNANIVRGYIAGTLFNAGTDYSVFMPCEENTTYTIQKMVAQPQTANRFRINSYDKIPAGGDSSISVSYFWNAGDGSDVTTHTYTTPAGAKYLGITVMTQNASGTTTIDEVLASIQIELGSTASAYEPYVGGQASPNPDYPQAIQTVTGEQTVTINSTTYPLSLGSIELCRIDGYGSSTYRGSIYKNLTDNKWYLHKEVGKYTFNGSEEWTQSSRTTTDMYVGALNIVSLGITANESRNKSLANRAIIATTSVVGSFSIFNISSGVSQYMCYAVSSSYASSLEKFKEKLATDNLIVYAPLATPTDTEITDATLIAQLEAIRTAALESGSNTISNTATGTNLAGDLEIGYYGYDPLNKYDKYFWLDVDGAYESL